MKSLYNHNGLVFWDDRSIRIRSMFAAFFAEEMRSALLGTNPAWRFMQVEAPILTPREAIDSNYTDEDVYRIDGLVLRPETTPGSYCWLRCMLDDSSSGMKLPACVWQVGKSFRREQDQPTKHVRLKEFYQQEFQCVYTSDSGCDYYAALVPNVSAAIGSVVHLPTRVVESDRLPSYSRKTLDVEVDNGDKWMEVCSISLRTDFPGTYRNKGISVVEVAIGLDRCVYNFMVASK